MCQHLGVYVFQVGILIPRSLIVSRAPFDTLAALTDTVIIEVIFEFVSNLCKESGFPLEARVGIEAVRRFKQSTNRFREKPEVKSWK
jgi:hypothetical protein